MRLLFSFLFILISTIQLTAQNATLSGYVKDKSSGETVIGAAITVVEANISTTTNAYGFYSITIPKGNFTILVSSMGQAEQQYQILLDDDKKLDILLEGITVLDEVVITDTRKDANVNNAQMGTTTLSTEQIKKLPVLFGETDILKAIQLLPGVQSAGEGNSGFYVRGGGPDQNLILLDEATVYNTGHLFGFFSIFNADAIKNVTLIKGGMPANYGGRLSSVLDVAMKDGNNQGYHGEGGIGLVASRLTFEGPIVKNKGSFMLSGRRTYIDALMKPFLKESGYYFYDANVKANYILGKKDRIFLSGYFGRDVFNFKSESDNFKVKIPWGNATSTLRWNHEWSNKLFMNTTYIYNDYNFAFNADQQGFSIQFKSAIRDLGAKVDFDYYLNSNHKFKFGAQYTNHKFLPNQFSGKSDSATFSPNNALIKYAHEMAYYLMDEWTVKDMILVNAGLRYSWFGQVGPYTSYIYQNSNPTDSQVYKKGQLVKTYNGLEPRLSMRFKLTPNSSIKASVIRSMQYMHSVSNNGTTLPTDIWVPSTDLVSPQKSWQYALGYFQNFRNNRYEASVELYYKDMQHQVEYRNGYIPNTLRDPQYDFVYGKGYAYGTEFFLNKTKGRFTGWVGYTLSWSWKHFEDLNNGDPFPAKYDRRHDISVVSTYELSPKWTFSGIFVFGTGNAITLPTGYYIIEQTLVQDYSKLNQYRIFPYHRADLSAVWTPSGQKTKKFKSTWNFSIYNIYNRMNPYFLFVDQEGSLSNGRSIKVKQVSIFPILPSITWNFKF